MYLLRFAGGARYGSFEVNSYLSGLVGWEGGWVVVRWVVGSNENITNSAKLELELGLSLAMTEN